MDTCIHTETFSSEQPQGAQVLKVLQSLFNVGVKMWLSALTREIRGLSEAAAAGQAPGEQGDRDQ